MEVKKFNNRVFGAAIVKAVNSNYNADFSGQPRTLPNGTVYATDKALKYTIKNYLKDVYPTERIFYFKNLNENLNPRSLDETYENIFGEYPNGKDMKIVVSRNLLKCIDIRLFGATFAGKTNISIHGPVQVNHGINIWTENNIFSEQITSPFSNKSNDPEAEKGMTTIGRQSKLEEGHYLHHFSVNPKNIDETVKIAGENATNLTEEDINKLKEAMRKGATYYDSASKAGTENELLIWVQLKENSKLVLPNFSQLIRMKDEKMDGKVVLDLSELSAKLKRYKDEIEKIEIYRNDASILIENKPDNANIFDL
jgi:CRISPR-associated protein Csh2